MLFDSLDKAAHAALEIAALQPAACDLMDRRHLNLARETDVRYELLIPGEAEAMLLVEQHADSRDELADEARRSRRAGPIQNGPRRRVARRRGRSRLPTVSGAWPSGSCRRSIACKASTRPTPCIEDIAVPPAALPVFLRHVQDTLKRLQVTASVFGHAGHGQLHIRPFLDLANPDDVRTMESLAAELYEKVWLLRGTISGEHGDGLSRTPFLARQYGPLVNVFRELKQIFDPQGLLNPGKMVPLAPTRMTQHMRPTGDRICASPSQLRERNADRKRPAAAPVRTAA